MATSSQQTINVDFRLVSAVLAVVIIAMLALWRPWQGQYDQNGRTVTVTGETTVKAVPDRFTFYPSYQAENPDKAAALNEATEKANEIAAKLKEMGVADKSIKTDVNGYRNYRGTDVTSQDEEYVYSAVVTVEVDNKDLAQKVQDYLATTAPEGSVTPQPTFSEEKRKQVETTARDQATKEARKKADQSAQNLGFRIAGVKAVKDSAGFGDIIPMYSQDIAASDGKTTAAPALQPGENQLTYSVTVEYYIR